MSSAYSSGPQGGRALFAPRYKRNTQTYTFTNATLSPNSSTGFVATAGVSISRVVGPQRISFLYNNFYWSFSITGGTGNEATDIAPMYSWSSSSAYNNTINYTLDARGIPPIGCTVTQLPKPAGTTRISVFKIQESVTGQNFIFYLALCPFSNIVSLLSMDSTSNPLGATLTMYLDTYRGDPSSLRNGNILSSFGAPTITTKVNTTQFLSNAGVNPLDAGTALPFSRISGQQTIVVLDTTTNLGFEFDVDYGIIGEAGGYIGYIDPSADAKLAAYPRQCTVTNIPIAGFAGAIMTPVSYSVASLTGDGRTYIFTFYPKNTVPTIQLSAGPALAGNNLEVRVYNRYFKYI